MQDSFVVHNEASVGGMASSTTVQRGSFHIWKICEGKCKEIYRGESTSSSFSSQIRSPQRHCHCQAQRRQVYLINRFLLLFPSMLNDLMPWLRKKQMIPLNLGLYEKSKHMQIYENEYMTFKLNKAIKPFEPIDCFWHNEVL